MNDLGDFLSGLGKTHREIAMQKAFVYKNNNEAEPVSRKSAMLMNLLHGYYDNDVFVEGLLRGRMTISEIRDLIEAICKLPDEQQ
jgi:hypothetical protein